MFFFPSRNYFNFDSALELLLAGIFCKLISKFIPSKVNRFVPQLRS